MMFSRFSWWLVLKFIQMPLEDKYQIGRLKEKKNIISNLDFNHPCRTSHRRCSRGSPGCRSWINLWRNLLYVNTKGWFTENFLMIDKWIAKIFNFSTFREKKVIEVWAPSFVLKEFLIQPGEPREHHLGEARP